MGEAADMRGHLTQVRPVSAPTSKVFYSKDAVSIPLVTEYKEKSRLQPYQLC